VPWQGTIPSDVGVQRREHKVLSWDIIGKSAPLRAEITIRKSQSIKPRFFATASFSHQPTRTSCIEEW
jgi:hypothetical protein